MNSTLKDSWEIDKMYIDNDTQTKYLFWTYCGEKKQQQLGLMYQRYLTKNMENSMELITVCNTSLSRVPVVWVSDAAYTTQQIQNPDKKT